MQRVVTGYGGAENADTAEAIRKILLSQTILLRSLYFPHATAQEKNRLPGLRCTYKTPKFNTVS
jgi:hypothetical protein